MLQLSLPFSPFRFARLVLNFTKVSYDFFLLLNFYFALQTFVAAWVRWQLSASVSRCHLVGGNRTRSPVGAAAQKLQRSTFSVPAFSRSGDWGLGSGENFGLVA